jgi:hypothetical protein
MFLQGSVDTDDPVLSNKANHLLIMEHILGRPSNNASDLNDEGNESPFQGEAIGLIECELTNTIDE